MSLEEDYNSVQVGDIISVTPNDVPGRLKRTCEWNNIKELTGQVVGTMEIKPGEIGLNLSCDLPNSDSVPFIEWHKIRATNFIWLPDLDPYMLFVGLSLKKLSDLKIIKRYRSNIVKEIIANYPDEDRGGLSFL